jgi:hypothetical protein
VAQQPGGVNGRWGAVAVQALAVEVADPRGEAEAEEVVGAEDDVNSYVDSCLCGMAGCRVAGRVREPRRGDDPVRRAPEDGRGQ